MFIKKLTASFSLLAFLLSVFGTPITINSDGALEFGNEAWADDDDDENDKKKDDDDDDDDDDDKKKKNDKDD